MKTTLIIILTLLTNTYLLGQNFSIGGEIGIVSSINNSYKLEDINNRRNTYYSGLNLNYHYDEKLSFTTGLHYLRQGYRHSTCYIFAEGVKNQLVGKVGHLAVPLTANIHLLQSRKLITSFGLLGTYNIKAVQDYPDPIGGCAIYYVPDLTPTTRSYSLSGIAGIGYKIFESDKFQIIPMLKYYQGLTNTFNNPFPDINIEIDRRYSSALLTFNLNYKI